MSCKGPDTICLASPVGAKTESFSQTVSSKPEFFARVIKVVEQQREERIKNEELRRRRVARKNTHQKTEAEARAKREEEARFSESLACL